MAEIHLLPLPGVIGSRARAVTALFRAVESGVDLGARGHHIQALKLSLESTLQMLQQAMATLPIGSESQAAEWQRVCADVDELTRAIERLMALCQTPPL